VPDQPASATLRSLVRPVYLPSVAAGIAVGMLVPVLPLYLRDHGSSFSVISTVLAAAGLGSILGGLPTGVFLARFSERGVLAGALVVMAVTAALLGLVTATLALVAFRLMFGMGTTGARLSVQSQVTRTVRPAVRGRAMAYIGGSMRSALFVGPLLGGVLLDWFGFTPTFVVCGALAALGLVGLVETGTPAAQPNTSPSPFPPGMVSSFLSHWRPMVVGGVGAALVLTAREGRYVVLPLIADDLGLSPAAVGALVAVGTGADLALFPLSGHLMDRHGRLFAIVPAFSLMAIGLSMLALADSAAMVGVAGVVMGVGNGMSSGTLMTVGSDLAPSESPGPFLAGMATIGDGGKVLGPLVVGVSADAFGLSVAPAVLAAILAVAIVYLIVVVGETSVAASARAA
jgi:MFS family permease